MKNQVFENGMRLIGEVKNTSVIHHANQVSVKSDALQKLYKFDSVLLELIWAILGRVDSEDMKQNLTVTKIETILKKRNVRDTVTYLELYDLYKEVYKNTCKFDFSKIQVFTFDDRKLFEPFDRVVVMNHTKSEESMKLFFESTMQVLITQVVPNSPFYFTIPLDVLHEGGEITVEVNSDEEQFIGLFIGKKGSNAKRLVEHLADVMTYDSPFVATKIDFQRVDKW